MATTTRLENGGELCTDNDGVMLWQTDAKGRLVEHEFGDAYVALLNASADAVAASEAGDMATSCRLCREVNAAGDAQAMCGSCSIASIPTNDSDPYTEGEYAADMATIRRYFAAREREDRMHRPKSDEAGSPVTKIKITTPDGREIETETWLVAAYEHAVSTGWTAGAAGAPAKPKAAAPKAAPPTRPKAAPPTRPKAAAPTKPKAGPPELDSNDVLAHVRHLVRSGVGGPRARAALDSGALDARKVDVDDDVAEYAEYLVQSGVR